MGFLNSVINQLGRDVGKAISNSYLKDSHSTPYRRVGSSSSNGETKVITKRSSQSPFEKAISFGLDYTPKTLLRKLSSAYVIFAAESKSVANEEYISHGKDSTMFLMCKKLIDKLDQISDVCEISGTPLDREEIERVSNKITDTFVDYAKAAKAGSENYISELEHDMIEVPDISFWRFVGLHAIYMGNYAKTGVKDMFKTIMANVLAWVTLGAPVLYLINMGIGASRYNKLNHDIDEHNNSNKALMRQENVRIDQFNDLISSYEKH